MALPKINTITFEITIPSTKKKMRFRPFLVKEEKILMLAQKGTPDDIFFAVKQLLTNCSIDPIDVDTLTTFDLDYIFIKLRAQSVGNIIELKFQDNEDGKTREFKVDLNEVEVTESPEHSKKIKINEQFGLLMKYPDVAMMNSIKDTDEKAFDSVMRYCLDSVYDETSVFPFSEETDEAIDEFVDSLDLKTFESIQKFFETMPKLKYVITYTNDMDNERTIVLDSLQSFFTFA
jgi:hypothetical protein